VDYHVPFGGSRAPLWQREQGFAAVEFFTQIKTAYSFRKNAVSQRAGRLSKAARHSGIAR
jgi:hypothetical protein